MGNKQSSVDKLSLAEKRYKINSPKKGRRRSQNRDPLKLKSSISMSLDRTTSLDDENLRVVVHSSSTGKVPDSNGPISQISIDSLTPVQTPTVLLTMSPFFTDQQQIMTKTQRDLIESSWKRSRKSGPENFGSKVFLLALIAEPDIKMVFGLDKLPHGRLKLVHAHPRFRKHAALISKSFDFAVKNLEFAEKLAQHFHFIGKKHVLMSCRGFKPHYWKTFADCMLQTTSEWLSDHRCQKTINAWRILIEFIIKHMKIGFDKEQLMHKRYMPISTTLNPTTLSVTRIQANQKTPRSQMLVASRQPAIQDQSGLCPPGRSANERSSSWVGTASFSEDFSRLRMTASQKHPKSRQATAPERERPESPNSMSDYYTPPSTRRSEANALEKKLLNAQHMTRSSYINA